MFDGWIHSSLINFCILNNTVYGLNQGDNSKWQKNNCLNNSQAQTSSLRMRPRAMAGRMAPCLLFLPTVCSNTQKAVVLK